MQELGKMVREAREEKGLNQYELAEKVDTSQPRISNLENDKFYPKFEVLENILSVLDLQLDISEKRN